MTGMMPLVSAELNCYTSPYIKSRADALANLPNPARWCPEREMWPRTATKGSTASQIVKPPQETEGEF
jgi:hypothetical protein